jgi:hypothetical protein
MEKILASEATLQRASFPDFAALIGGQFEYGVLRA